MLSQRIFALFFYCPPKKTLVVSNIQMITKRLRNLLHTNFEHNTMYYTQERIPGPQTGISHGPPSFKVSTKLHFKGTSLLTLLTEKRDSMNNSNPQTAKKLHFSQTFNYSRNQRENNGAYISLSSISPACLSQLRMAPSSKTNGPKGKRNNPQTI